jgi:hypothetical protein
MKLLRLTVDTRLARLRIFRLRYAYIVMASDAVSLPSLTIPLALPMVVPLRWKILVEVLAQVLYLQRCIPTTTRELFLLENKFSEEAADRGAGTRGRRTTSSAWTALQTFCTQWDTLCTALWDILCILPAGAALISIGNNVRRPKFAVFVNFERLDCLSLLALTTPSLATAAGDSELELETEHILPMVDLPIGHTTIQRVVPCDGVKMEEWGSRDEDTPLQRAVARKIARILITEGPSVGLDKLTSVKCPPVSVLLYLPMERSVALDERLEMKPGFTLSRTITRPYVISTTRRTAVGSRSGGPRLSVHGRKSSNKLVEITCESTSDAGTPVPHSIPSDTHVWAKIKVPLRGLAALPKPSTGSG